MPKKGYVKDKSKTSFLIAESHSSKRKSLMEMLRTLGYTLFEQASDGTTAFHILKRRPIDYIISNLELPQMNGMALLKVVSEDETLFKIPFVLVAPSITKDIVLEAGKCGVSGILLEPITPIMLEEKVGALEDEPIDNNEIKTEELFERASELIEQGDHEDALEVYKKVLSVYEDAEVYYNIGYVKTAQGKYDEAIIAFRKAVKINNLYAKAYKMMGEAYKKNGDPEEAENCFSKAGEIYLQRNMNKEAEDAYKEVLKINPDTVNVYNSLGIVYRKQHNYKEAIRQYRAALKVDPEDENIYFNLGRALLEHKNIGEAKEAFKAALNVNPDFAQATRMLQAIAVGFKGK